MQRLKFTLMFLLLMATPLSAQVVRQPVPPQGPIACAFNNTPVTLADGQVGILQCDANGRISVTVSGGVDTTTKPTTNASVSITLGNTFQTILASSTTRRSLQIQNNNVNDDCYLFIGAGTATIATSIRLTPGGSYNRYFPYIPSDAIQATCATTADTMYVDYQ